MLAFFAAFENFFFLAGTWGDTLNANSNLGLSRWPDQPYEKVLPLDIIWRDLRAAELWVEDKAQRQASFGLLRCVLSQLEDVWPDLLELTKLPSSVLIDPILDVNEDVHIGSDGKATRRNHYTGKEAPILPDCTNTTWTIRIIHELA